MPYICPVCESPPERHLKRVRNRVGRRERWRCTTCGKWLRRGRLISIAGEKPAPIDSWQNELEAYEEASLERFRSNEPAQRALANLLDAAMRAKVRLGFDPDADLPDALELEPGEPLE